MSYSDVLVLVVQYKVQYNIYVRANRKSQLLSYAQCPVKSVQYDVL